MNLEQADIDKLTFPDLQRYVRIVHHILTVDEHLTGDDRVQLMQELLEEPGIIAFAAEVLSRHNMIKAQILRDAHRRC
jgi:hypothetical protein